MYIRNIYFYFSLLLLQPYVTQSNDTRIRYQRVQTYTKDHQPNAIKTLNENIINCSTTLPEPNNYRKIFLDSSKFNKGNSENAKGGKDKNRKMSKNRCRQRKTQHNSDSNANSTKINIKFGNSINRRGIVEKLDRTNLDKEHNNYVYIHPSKSIPVRKSDNFPEKSVYGSFTTQLSTDDRNNYVYPKTHNNQANDFPSFIRDRSKDLKNFNPHHPTAISSETTFIQDKTKFPKWKFVNSSHIMHVVPKSDYADRRYGKQHKFVDIQNLGYNSSGGFLDYGVLTTLKNKTYNYAKKFLNLVTVVKFPNEICRITISGTLYEGVCLLQSECDQHGGESGGSCAKGHGVCCVFRSSCGGSSNRNCTYFESPGYPNYYPNDTMVLPPDGSNGNNNTIDPRLRWRFHTMRISKQLPAFSCNLNIFKASSNIKMLRIDFLDFELNGPINGTCTDERFVVMGQNENDIIPELCGFNTGQHIYVDVSQVSEDSPIQFSVLANTLLRRRFRIRICQIAENCPTLQNCLQYYTGLQGVISTFNYDQTALYNRSYPGYLNNLNYAICIRKEAGYCSITYTNVQNGVEYPFELVNLNENGLETVPAGEAGIEMFNCPDDYIVINGLRLCGYKLNDGSENIELSVNAPVTDDSNGPFIIPVRTNDEIVGRGFKLFYRQNAC